MYEQDLTLIHQTLLDKYKVHKCVVLLYWKAKGETAPLQPMTTTVTMDALKSKTP